MKIASILLISLIIFSCSDDYKPPTEEVRTIINPELLTKSNNSIVEFEVTCDGNCGVSEGSCPIKWDMANGLVSCDCEESCKMTLHYSYADPLSGSIQNSLSHISQEFITNKSAIWSVDKINFTIDYSKLIEFIKISFTENGKYRTISYLLSYSSNDDGTYSLGPNGPKIEVDCSGSCSGEGNMCTEQYLIAEGKVQCSCEGDGCKMTITEG